MIDYRARHTPSPANCTPGFEHRTISAWSSTIASASRVMPISVRAWRAPARSGSSTPTSVACSAWRGRRWVTQNGDADDDTEFDIGLDSCGHTTACRPHSRCPLDAGTGGDQTADTRSDDDDLHRVLLAADPASSGVTVGSPGNCPVHCVLHRQTMDSAPQYRRPSTKPSSPARCATGAGMPGWQLPGGARSRRDHLRRRVRRAWQLPPRIRTGRAA